MQPVSSKHSSAAAGGSDPAFDERLKIGEPRREACRKQLGVMHLVWRYTRCIGCGVTRVAFGVVLPVLPLVWCYTRWQKERCGLT